MFGDPLTLGFIRTYSLVTWNSEHAKSEIVFVHEVLDEIFIHSSLLCCFEELCCPLAYRFGADTNISTQLCSIKNSHPSACLHESINCHGFCVSVVRFLSTNIDKHSVASSFLFYSN